MAVADAIDLHPDYHGAHHTLQGLFRSPHDAARASLRHVSRGRLVIEFEQPAPSGRILHAVAAREYAVRQRRARIPQEWTAPWLGARVALEAFRLAERGAAARGRHLRWYKPLEEEKLHALMTRYDFRGTRLDVAARLMSDTILAHPFPNANHRSSISLARTWLESEGVGWPAYSLRGRGIGRLIRETEPHILRSKYLLQLRRRLPLVRVAHEEGFRFLEVKKDAPVPIVADDLTLGEGEVRDRHRSVCRQLLESLAGPALPEMHAPATRGLRELASWYYGANPGARRRRAPSR